MSKKYPGGFVTALSPAGYSVSFDGSGDYLTIPSPTPGFSFSVGEFTVEMWVYKTAARNDGLLDARATPAAVPWFLGIDASNRPYFYDGAVYSSSIPVTLNAWSHVALVRTSGVLKIFVNGVQGYSASYSVNLDRTAGLVIGDTVHGAAPLLGYISDLRIVKGTAVYTANFAPPNQLFNIPNTSLLTCNSPAIVDQSSNNFTITPFGNAAVSTLTPFSVVNAYNPALGASTPGVWTLDQALQAQATGQWNMYDPYFNLTTLLLPGNGTNGAQNNTFLDSSTNNFTITRNGNTTQGTFSPFSQTGWSSYFNGGSDRISNASAGVMDVGTNNFTIEMWYYPTSTADQMLFEGPVNLGFQFYIISGVLSFGHNGAVVNYTLPSNFYNSWHHLCVVREGTGSNQLSLYVDGVRQAQGTLTANITTTGFQVSRTSTYLVFGYISNLRVVKNTAVYTGTAFTVPTAPLTAIANTSLLICQSNRFLDNSSNAYALTVGGTPSVQAFSPFAKAGAYNTLAVGGSGYFDGSGDYLSVPDNAAFDFGTGALTVEAWIYTGTKVNYQSIIGTFDGSSNAWYLHTDSSGFVVYGLNASTPYTASVQVCDNAWHHIAMVRNGSSALRLYVDGALAGSQTDSTNVNTVAEVRIGSLSSGAARFFTGYISNVRIVKGTALYTAAFTPPTAPLTIPSNTNVSLLLNFTNAGITDATSKNALETVGNAQISTAQSKFGGSSMYFDGSGDYLVMPPSPNFAFGTGPFTIEGWVRIAANGDRGIFQQGTSSFPAGTSNSVALGYNNSGTWQIYAKNTNTNSSATYVTNTWYHFALVRAGTTTTLYINGTSVISLTADTTNYTGTYFGVGSIYGTSGTNLNGYIDDLRITKGYARYTSNFTPPTSALQLQGAGSQITPLLPNATYFMGIVGGSNTTNETAASVAVDADQNLYVAGYESTTGELLKVSPTGQLLFQKALSLSGVSTGVVTSGSNVYISSSYPFGNVYGVASQINSSGTAQWSRILSSVNPEGYNGVAVNSTGTNIYWAGYTQITGARRALLACYDASGVLQFQVASTSGGTTNEFKCVAVASNGNIYAGASVFTGSGYYSEVVILNSSGVVQAQYRINALTDINSIAVDSAFNIYVVGTGGYLTGLLVKLNNSGVVQWAKSFASYNTEQLAVNEDYNSVFLSTYDNTGAVIAKVDLSGTVLWQRRLTPSTGALYPYALTIDTQQGNVYLGAALQATYSDMFFAKLPPDGSLTGTYNVGGVSVTYGTVSVVSSTSVSATAGSISISTSALTASSSSVSTSNSSFSSSIILL